MLIRYVLKIDGTWCRWSNWSRCSVRTGTGIVVRKRFCRHSVDNYNTSCLGPHTEIGQCYMVDGKKIHQCGIVFSTAIKTETLGDQTYIFRTQ